MKIIRFSVKPLIFLLSLLVLFSTAAKGVSPSETDKPTIHLGSMKSAGIDPEKIEQIQEMLSKGLTDSAYPGGVFISVRNSIIFAKIPFGNLTYAKDALPMTIETIFDLASMSKVIGTTCAAMLLYDDGLLKFDQKVSELIPEFRQNGKEDITIRQLLTHSSGLPAWEKLWKKGNTPKEMFDYLYTMPLSYRSDSLSVYSCLGFITLGKVCEILAGKPLDVFLSEWLFDPLNMNRTGYNPSKILIDEIAPTEFDAERGGVVHGKVHDENAYWLGGVSGNAGLFSTAEDLAVFGQMMLNGGIYNGKRIFREETVRLFTSRQNIVDGSSRALGWDTPTGHSSAGQYFSKKSFGHTGFTGTSIWIDPEKNLIGILLTNRVHPTRNNEKLYDFRDKIYDLLRESVID
ncbi:MAG: serine hydrolase [Candidatus Marinimicrobia bacterium]|nr:serine hydrolase [Candidatus Neomarinimicrobiota bacterium]